MSDVSDQIRKERFHEANARLFERFRKWKERKAQQAKDAQEGKPCLILSPTVQTV